MCNPNSIPNIIIFDGKNVTINQKIFISDLVIPTDTILKENNMIIASCIGSRLKEENTEKEVEEKTETK